MRYPIRYVNLAAHRTGQDGKRDISSFFPISVVYLAFVFVAAPCAVAGGVVFGPEFTFSSKAMRAWVYLPFGGKVVNNPSSVRAMMRLAEKIKQRCGDCTVRQGDRTKDRTTNFRVDYPDGFWMEIGTDPGVVEVTTKPGTAEDFVAREARLNMLFESAKALGLDPSSRTGSGHINVDIETAFYGNAMLFRNFLVDMANHPELFTGILGDNKHGAPTVTDFRKSRREAFAKVIQDFDEGRISTMEALITAVNERAYDLNRYVAIALAYAGKNRGRDRRIEIRGIHAQNSFAEFLGQIRLLEARINYLRSKSVLLPLAIPNARFGRAQNIERFKAFVAEMGYDEREAARLIRPEIKVPWYDRPMGEIFCAILFRRFLGMRPSP